jgi:hypothetical protein
MPPTNETFTLLRADDLLALRFEIINLRVETFSDRPPQITRIERGLAAFIIVHFPPQHILEEAFIEDDNTGILLRLSNPPVWSILAGPSRLVFKLPDEKNQIPLTVESLLDWKQYEFIVAPNALPRGATEGPAPAQPSAEQTAIELPYRLIVSPDSSAGWVHTTKPVTHANRTELWHTRLGVRTQQQNVDDRNEKAVRAIWSPDITMPLNQFDCSLTAGQRAEIVRLSSDFSIIIEDHSQSIDTNIPGPPQTFNYQPEPLAVERLMLSTLGGWLHAHSSWSFPEIDGNRLRTKEASVDGKLAFSLTDWRHFTGMGRDQYVRTVDRGFLFPFGNRASLVRITERKFKSAPSGEIVAYLAQHNCIVVQEPEKDYDKMQSAFAKSGREMPLRRIRITTLTTPSLDFSGEIRIFLPRLVGGGPFQFHIEAIDLEGGSVDFAVPMVFVPLTSTSKDDIKTATDFFATQLADIRGQMVAFAKHSDGPGDNSPFKTIAITFGAMAESSGLRVSKLPAGQPPFLPFIQSADVSIPAIDHLLGTSGTSGATTIEFHPQYLDHEFDPTQNRGQVFARMKPLSLMPPADKVGGLVTPNMKVDGLSRSLGVVPRVDDIVQGRFEPTAVFDGMKARLLGAIDLKTLIRVAADTTSSGLDSQVPKLIHTRTATAEITSFTWKPNVNRVNDVLVTTDETKLAIEVHSTRRLDGAPPTLTVEGTLTNFSLNLIDLINVSFEKLKFGSQGGAKTEVKAEGINVRFKGPLQFVQNLADILPANGFNDGPSISVSPAGIITSYSLVVPNAGVGAFSLENIALSASLSLPFDDKPTSLRLAFSRRDHPFLVTVSLVGGAGFFAIELSTAGIELIEGAIEAGGNFTISLGVVDANAHVMAGFYFSIKQNGDLLFSAYLRVGGSVELLGIVGISIDIYVGLSFHLEPGELQGYGLSNDRCPPTYVYPKHHAVGWMQI